MNRDYQLLRQRAYRKASYARSIKKLISEPCQVCGDLLVEGHHTDYTKPLDVIWLCKQHHLELHGKKLQIAKKRNEYSILVERHERWLKEVCPHLSS